MVSHLGEARPVPPDAARRVEEPAARRHAEPFQDPLEVVRLRFAGGPRVLVDREEDLRVAEEERFGPVTLAHRLTMFVGLFGRVARSLGIARTRLQEGLHDPFGILIANPRGQLPDLARRVDLVVRLLRDSIAGRVLRHDHQDDFRGVLLQEPGEPFDGRGLEGREGFDDEEDRSTPRDDGGVVSRNAAALVLDAETQGTVLVLDTLSPHLPAYVGLELRLACVAHAGGHRRAPFMASMTARPKADVRTSLAPGSCRARSYVSVFERTTDFTALRRRAPASRHPRYSSIITPAKISPVGFTLSIPAYFGALPWIGSKTAWASPMLPPGATPSPPIWAAAASLR